MSTSVEIGQLGRKALRVSHLEKLYWAQAGVTKGEMLRYYR